MTEYGGSPESFAWWRGQVVPGARLALWTDRDRTTPVTDLVTVDGEPITDGFVRADDAGWFRFATVGTYQTLYGEILGGDGRLYRVDRADIGTRVFGVESQVTAVGQTADTALSTAQAAQSAANAAHDLVTGELAQVNQPEGLTRLNADGMVPSYLLPNHTQGFLTWGDYPTAGPEVWPSPIGYRGMGTHEQQGLAPENTAEGIRSYLDKFPVVPGQQVPAVWLDCFILDDGSTGVIRSGPGGPEAPTLTTATYPQEMTALTLRTARVSGSKWGPRWPNLPVPSLEDVMAEFAGRALFVLYVRGTQVLGSLWQTVLTYGMQDSVILCGDTDLLELTPSAKVMALFDSAPPTAGQLADLVAEGTEWVALNCAGLNPVCSSADIAAARAAGLRVMAYPLTRHYELDRCIAGGDAANPWGVDAFATPDPVYCRFDRPKVHQFAAVPWHGNYAPGQLGNGPAGDAPVRHPVYQANAFAGSQAAALAVNDPDANQTKLLDPGGLWCFFEHQGWGRSPFYEANKTTRRLRIEVGYQFRRGAGTSWLTVGFGFSDDRPFQYQGTGTTVLNGPPGQNGWIVVCRGDGNLYLRKVTNGTMSSGDTASNNTGPGGAVTPGPTSPRQRLRIDLYPDRVECYVMAGMSGNTVLRSLVHADTDPAARGPYFSIGSRQAELLIINPTASDAPA